jgi:hypothetical protein
MTLVEDRSIFTKMLNNINEPYNQKQSYNTGDLLYPLTTKMGSLDFKLNHQIKAKNIFNCDMFVRELDSMIYDYYYEIMLNNREILFFMNEEDDQSKFIEENATESTKINDNDQQLMEEEEEEEEGEDANLYKRPKIGGELNDDCVKSLIWCLNYGIPDSLHDFGKSRNGIFPQLSKTKNRAHDFLQISEQFLNQNYSIHGKISTYDKLYNYYSNNPANFEDIVKDDFLLGNICGDVDNIYYYFSEDIPSTWPYNKKDFFETTNPPNQMNPFFEKLSSDGYEYCILDACMSIQTESKWQDKITMIKSLCNLWDPVGAGKIQYSELADGNPKYNLSLVYENNVIVNGITHYIYDSKNNGESMYDYVYENLFNLHCIPGITFKLRIASETDFRTNILNSALLYPLLSITTSGKNPIYIPIPFGGFSVKVLSMGLYYIETGDDFIIPPKQADEYMNLKRIIDEVLTIINRLEPKTRTYYMYILLTRFKSTGDHGSAMTTEFFNEKLKLNTLYLSGDRLAYIYSIAKNIPTVARYYAASSSSAMEVDEESEESCDRVHFLGVLLPQKDPIITATNKLNEILSFLDYLPKSGQPADNKAISIDEIQNSLIRINNTLKNSIGNASEDPLNPSKDTLDNNTIFASIKVHLAELLPQLHSLTIDDTNIHKIKPLLTILKEYHDNVYYIFKYDDIKSDIEKTIHDQISELQKIIVVNADEIITGSAVVAENVRASRRAQSSFRPITWLANILTKGSKDTTTSDEFIALLQKTQDTETQSYYDKIISIKKRFYAKMTDLSLFMKEKYGKSAPFVVDQSKKTMSKYNENITTILQKDNTVLGQALLKLFGFVSDPVIAIPIDDEFIEDIKTVVVSSPVPIKNISSSSKQKITDKIKNAAKSVANYFKPRQKRKRTGGSRKNRMNNIKKNKTKNRMNNIKKNKTKNRMLQKYKNTRRNTYKHMKN